MSLNKAIKQLKNEIKIFDLDKKKITKRLSDEVFNLAYSLETVFLLQEDTLDALTLKGIVKDTNVPINIRKRAKKILNDKKSVD